VTSHGTPFGTSVTAPVTTIATPATRSTQCRRNAPDNRLGQC
jgi:hypothetical protein